MWTKPFLWSTVLLAAASPAPPASPGPVRVLVLLSHESPAYREAADGLRAHLWARGVVAELDVRVVPSAGEPIRQRQAPNPDLVVALGTPAAGAAARQLAAIPLVAVTLRQSELAKLGSATGIYLEFPPDTEFRWMRRILPQARRVGVVYNPAENQSMVARAVLVAEGLGLRLTLRPVESRTKIPDALASLANEVDVLLGVADTLALAPETARAFLLFGFRQRIPFVGLSEAWVRAGALYALDRDWEDIGRQCGELAEQILAGRPTGSLGPAPPRKVLYYLNRQTAQTLRLELPDNVLSQAREPAP